MTSRHDRYALGAVAILVGAILFEAYRLAMPWPGYAPPLSRTASASLMTLWAVNGVSILFRRRHRVFATLGWVLGFLSPIFMVGHAAITRVGGSYLGLVYFAVALAFVFAMKHTFDAQERARLPTKDPGGRPPRAEKAYRLMPKPRH